jgi:hypothetical protein
MIGVAMGATATGLIYSPWGKRSGAHMNPAVTITFLRLGKIPLRDALFYIVFQFFGGLVGVLLTALILGNFFAQPPVNYVATVPGPAGDLPAFLGELVIAFIMMGMIVYVSNEPAIAHFTGLFAGLLIMCYVTFEARGLPASRCGRAAFRVWDEPGTNVRFRAAQRHLDRHVDLLHSVSGRHALSGPRLFARERSRIDSVLQASPSIRPALHLLRPTHPSRRIWNRQPQSRSPLKNYQVDR